MKVKWGWTWPGSSGLGWSAAPATDGSASSQLTAPVGSQPGKLDDRRGNEVMMRAFMEITPGVDVCVNGLMKFRYGS